MKELKKAKQQYIINLSTPKTKQFWSAIKSLNGANSSQIPTLSCNTETITEDKKKAEAINKFFHSCFNTTHPPFSEEQNLESRDPATCPNELLLCTEDEILSVIQALDTSKANGPDNISAKMLKRQWTFSYLHYSHCNNIMVNKIP